MKKTQIRYFIIENKVSSFKVDKKNKRFYYPVDADKNNLRKFYKVSETFATRRDALLVLMEQISSSTAFLRSKIRKNNETLKTIRTEINKTPDFVETSSFKMNSYNPEKELN